MLDPRTDMARGARAAFELEETSAAFAAVEAAMLAELRKAPVGADARILNLHAALQNLDAVKAALVRTVTNGRTAEIYQAAAEAVEDGFGEPESTV